MIGMMNSRLDSFEFYAGNSGENNQSPVEEDTKVLTEPKKRSCTAYTQDGRLVMNGKVVDEKEAKFLWSEVLLRSAVNKTVNKPLANEEKTKK